MSRFTSPNLDFFGFFASALCAVHCLALPFLFTFGMVGGLEWLAHGVLEFAFVGLALVFATWSLARSVPRHRSYRPLYIALAGFAFLVLSRFPEGEMEHYLTAVGGIIIAWSHYVNWRLLQSCPILSSPINKRSPESQVVRA